MMDLDELLDEYKVAKKSQVVFEKKHDELKQRLVAAENAIECNNHIITGIENIVAGMGHRLLLDENDEWLIV